MPPGSKKRKAAKKKKQKEPITSPPHHSQSHSHEGDDDPRHPDGKELSDGCEISSPLSGHTDELEKNNNKEDSPSEMKELSGINQEDPVVEVFINGSSLQQSETSKSSSSCRSSGSSSSSSSDDNESHHSHTVEKNILIVESITGGYKEDDHYDPKPSDLDLSVKDASALLEETELEKNSVHQTHLPEDLSAVSSVNSIPPTDDEVVEENDIVPEAIQEVEKENGIVPEAIQEVDEENGIVPEAIQEVEEENGIVPEAIQEVEEEDGIVPEAIQEVEETVTITESQVKADKLVSEAIVTGFPKDSTEKDFQSSSVVSDNDLKKTSWISCCGLFELFSGSNR